MPSHLFKRQNSPHWWIDLKVKGRRRIRRSAGTADRQTAQALAEKLEAAEWGRLIHGDSAALTFAEAVLIYVDDGKSDLFTDKLVAHFRNRRVADIGPGDIQAAAKVLYPDARPATWNRQVIVPARAVINHAAGKMVNGRPLANFIRVKTFKELRPVRAAPGPGWHEAFIARAEPRLAALALFMRITAARVGQAIAVEWPAIDLTAATAVIPAAKGFPARLARLTPHCVALLANLKGREGPVFGFVNRWEVYRPWRAACAAANIPFIGPHSAGRRAFATAMRAAGVDPKTAARRGGWASIRLMLDVYAGEDDDPALIDRVFGTFESHKPRQKSRKAPKSQAVSK